MISQPFDFPSGSALVASRMSSCWSAGADDPYCNFVRENFNYAVAENSMKWRSWEYDYNAFNNYDTDMMMEWLNFHGKGFRAHCLFWDVDSPGNFPDWVYSAYGQEMVDYIHHRIETAQLYFQVCTYSTRPIFPEIC